MPPERIKLGSVGKAAPWGEVAISPEGEILIKGDFLFMGYLNQPEKTAETIDARGWLHTGDVGEWVDGRFLKITGRAKDIIITSGGKNITPSEIENAIKASPYVKEAVVVGDGRKFLSALVGIELDTVGDWAQRNGVPYTTYRDLSEKAEVVRLIQGVLRDANERFARVEQIKRFRMIPKELDHEDGELTATQKVKRAAVAALFADHVEAMYGGAPVGAGAEV